MNLFQNIVPEHLIEALILILGSFFFGYLLDWLRARKKYSKINLQWENRFNAKSRDYNELRDLYTSINSKNKELSHKFDNLDLQFQEAYQKNQSLTSEKQTLTTEVDELQSKTRNFEMRIADLELIEQKYQNISPVFETTKQQLKDLQSKVGNLESQKIELSNIVSNLKDYRTKYEEVQVQLASKTHESDELRQKLVTLEREVEDQKQTISLNQGMDKQKVWELEGELRWAGADKSSLTQQISTLQHSLEQAAFEHLEQEGSHILLQSELNKLKEEHTSLQQSLLDSPQQVQSSSPSEEQLIELEKLRNELSNERKRLLEIEGEQRFTQSDYLKAQSSTDAGFKRISDLEAALRWAEADKENLSRKVEELEFASSTIQNVSSDQHGELSNISLELEEVREKYDNLLEKQEQIQPLIEELKGKLRWTLLEKEELQQQIHPLQQDSLSLATTLQDSDLQQSMLEELRGKLRWANLEKEESFQALNQLHSSIEQAALAQLDLEGENVRLSRELRAIQEQGDSSSHDSQVSSQKLSTIESELQRNLKDQQELTQRLTSLQQTAELAAQENIDREAENIRLTLELKELKKRLEDLSLISEQVPDIEPELQVKLQNLEAEKGELTRQIEELQETAHLAAQDNADREAENIRLNLELKNISLQAEKLNQDEGASFDNLDPRYLEEEKDQLLLRIEELQQSAGIAAQDSVDKAAENTRLILEIRSLQQKIDELETLNVGNQGPAISSTFTPKLSNEEKELMKIRIKERAVWTRLDYGRIGTAYSSQRDNLQRIEGIDEFTEELLNLINIFTFRQIANFTDEEVQTVTKLLELTLGQIASERWVEQAEQLM